ncbi:M48 family metallopeptidase [Collinsella tanakaei]|uniref:M48 family metallopeptidase n=1 Tax=Collinsella tanakaei TaxID=626935 RepID=UPI00248EF0CE|nr:SprT family zinc-dependent metalloprotease [Collinsella tanakaei]
MCSSASGNAVRTAVITTTSGDRSIQATVTRKHVKNLNLRVHADGTVTMSMPMRTSIARAQDFLDRKAPWIAQRLECIEAARNSRGIIHPAAAPADSADAVTKPRLLLWGEEVDAYSTLQKHGLLPEVFGGADSNAAGAGIDTARLQRLVDVLYKQEVARAIPQIAQPLESAMGVAASRWQVRSMKTRWGSCTPKTAAIRINSQLAAYPIDCLNFVVAHELVHLMEPSHNARFHMLLDVYCPRNRELAAQLKHAPA